MPFDVGRASRGLEPDESKSPLERVERILAVLSKTTPGYTKQLRGGVSPPSTPEPLKVRFPTHLFPRCEPLKEREVVVYVERQDAGLLKRPLVAAGFGAVLGALLTNPEWTRDRLGWVLAELGELLSKLHT